LAIDTTGDVPSSGGANDPWGNPISFAYTSTRNNISATAQTTLNTILPDVVIRGNLKGAPPTDSDHNDGLTELRVWNGSNWQGAAFDWGGLKDPIGPAHIAYSNGNGVELAIPFVDIGIAPTATVNLQFFVTRNPGVESNFGAIDTIP